MTADAGMSGAAASPPAATQRRGRLGAGLRIAGVIGRELDSPLSEMQAIVQDFIRTGRITRSQVQQLNAAIDQARGIARRSQALGQACMADAGAVAEPLRLDIAVTRAFTQRMPELQRLGVTLEHQLAPLTVAIDAGLLSSLVDAAIECGARPGHTVAVTLTARGEPAQAILVLQARPREVAHQVAIGHTLDQLCWHVLREVADVVAAHVDHGTQGDAQVLQLTLGPLVTPASRTEFEDTSATEDSWLHGSSLGLGGHRVLLISSQPAIRLQVAHICDSMGLHLTWAPSPAVAESQVATVRPDLVLADSRAEEARTDSLRQHLLTTDPAFPWLRIEKESSPLSLEHWMSEQEERLTPHNLRARLPQLLLLNLSRGSPR